VSFSRDPVFVWRHDVNTNTSIIDFITDVYKMYMEMELLEGETLKVPWIWLSMDISMCGYQTYVGHAVDASTNV